MPPLLPEYLSQTARIIFEAPSTDWGPVLVGAAATLFGAALGAGIGGYVAYRGSVRANNSLLQRQKLEEAFSMLLRLEGHVRSIRTLVTHMPQCAAIDIENEKASKALYSLEFSDVERLRTLLKIYGRKFISEFTELDDFFRSFEASVLLNSVDDKKYIPLPREIANYMAMSKKLKNALILELKL